MERLRKAIEICSKSKDPQSLVCSDSVSVNSKTLPLFTGKNFLRISLCHYRNTIERNNGRCLRFRIIIHSYQTRLRNGRLKLNN